MMLWMLLLLVWMLCMDMLVSRFIMLVVLVMGI